MIKAYCGRDGFIFSLPPTFLGITCYIAIYDLTRIGCCFFPSNGQKSCVSFHQRREDLLFTSPHTPGRLIEQACHKKWEKQPIGHLAYLVTRPWRSLWLQLHSTKCPALYCPHRQSHSGATPLNTRFFLCFQIS